MSGNPAFHRLARHRLTSADMLTSTLVEADQHERILRREHHHTSDTDWAADIGFALGPTNRLLNQMLQEESISDDPTMRERVLALQYDQQRLLTGWRPSPFDLHEAPSIAPDMIFVTSGDQCDLINLAGFVKNVPTGGPDRRRVTSLIVAFDAAKFEWVRTLSRFYRLEPVPPQPDQHGIT
jgi:hypothetical protein